MEKQEFYQLSHGENSPRELEFMERDMIKGKIKYGIVKSKGKYILVRDVPRDLEATKIDIDSWHKPFKMRTSLED